MKFFADESCGQCTPCRVGTVKALQLMDDEAVGRAAAAGAVAGDDGRVDLRPGPGGAQSGADGVEIFSGGSRSRCTRRTPRCRLAPVSFTLNGKTVVGRAGPDDPRDRRAARHRDPAPLLHGRHAARRQLPHLHGGDQGRARAGAVLLPLSQGRDGGHHQQRAGARPARRCRSSCCCRTCRRRPTRSTPSSICGRRSWRSASRASRARQQPAEDLSHPAMAVHLDACIQCKRCVRACREEQVNDVIGYAFRGGQSKIVFDLDDPMGDSTCVACGECVQACPTGALMPARDVAQGRARQAGRFGVPVLRRRLPAHLQHQGQHDPLRAGQGRPGELEPPVRQGALRLRLRAAPASPDQAADPQAGRAEAQGLRRRSRQLAATSSARRPGKKRSTSRPRGCAKSATPTASGRSPASARPRAPTKRRISSRSWCAPASARTTSTTARACATRRASRR